MASGPSSPADTGLRLPKPTRPSTDTHTLDGVALTRPASSTPPSARTILMDPTNRWSPDRLWAHRAQSPFAKETK
jgi:hypothetical protein